MHHADGLDVGRRVLDHGGRPVRRREVVPRTGHVDASRVPLPRPDLLPAARPGPGRPVGAARVAERRGARARALAAAHRRVPRASRMPRCTRFSTATHRGDGAQWRHATDPGVPARRPRGRPPGASAPPRVDRGHHRRRRGSDRAGGPRPHPSLRGRRRAPRRAAAGRQRHRGLPRARLDGPGRPLPHAHVVRGRRGPARRDHGGRRRVRAQGDPRLAAARLDPPGRQRPVPARPGDHRARARPRARDRTSATPAWTC